jgi:hypothetical protein
LDIWPIQNLLDLDRKGNEDVINSSSFLFWLQNWQDSPWKQKILPLR